MLKPIYHTREEWERLGFSVPKHAKPPRHLLVTNYNNGQKTRVPMFERNQVISELVVQATKAMREREYSNDEYEVRDYDGYFGDIGDR